MYLLLQYYVTSQRWQTAEIIPVCLCNHTGDVAGIINYLQTNKRHKT